VQETKWFKAKISDVMNVGTYYRIIRTAKPRDYFYVAGQHTLVKFKEEQDPQLVFSFASHPQDDFLEFCVINSGVAPAEDGFKPGREVFLTKGQGQFVYQRTTYPDLVFIAGGSGISPIRSLLSDVLLIGTAAKIHLYFGCRDSSSFPYAVEFLELKQAGHLFDVRLTAEDKGTPPFTKGLITQALTFQSKKADYYVCGPMGLIDKVKEILGNAGVPDENIHHEIYV
jgi:ferredoxin-NADP reductase